MAFWLPRRSTADPAETVLERSGDVRLYWWSGVPNLGDAVARVLVEGLSGRPVVAVGKRARRKLIACGSTIHRARRGDIVWGTGTLHAGQVPADARIDVRAVRGPLTAMVLRRAGIEVPEVYGDPALLLPHVHPIAVPPTRRHRLGVIPHYQDKDAARALLGDSAGDAAGESDSAGEVDDRSVVLLDIQGDLATFLETLLACDRVIASSLHGVIFAEAYGVPAAEWRITDRAGHDRVRGAAHKFEDYFRGTGRERPAPLLADEWRIERAAPPPIVDPALLRSFPLLASEHDPKLSTNGDAPFDTGP